MNEEIFQKLSEVSKGLLPILAIFFTAINSWHCSIMCGPILSVNQTGRYFYFNRIISYAVLGFLAGLFGKILIASLEFKLISFLSLGIFFLISMYVVFPTFFRIKKKKLTLNLSGLLMGFVPCHLLGFYYSIAILSGSPLVGSVLLFNHGLMSIPALAFFKKYNSYLVRRSSYKINLLIKTLIIVLVLFNFYTLASVFWGRHNSTSVLNIICNN